MQDAPDFFAAVDKLGTFGELDAEAMRYVYRVERVGETFYERIAERIGNAEAADLLLKNAREERGHAERLRRALALKLGRDWQPAAEDFALYPIPLPDAIGAELLAGIVAGELSGDASYQEWPIASRTPRSKSSCARTAAKRSCTLSASKPCSRSCGARRCELPGYGGMTPTLRTLRRA